MVFTEDLWAEWSQKIEHNFEIKGYDHFDFRFDFPKRKQEIKRLVSDSVLLSRHPFLPFIKIEIKTPRFRYQENEKEYGLETKVRPISFASHFDTYLYSFYSFVLTKKYQAFIKDKGFDECVLAYRSDLNGKCNIQFAKEVFDFVKVKGKCAALALDIKGYFDNIDHDILEDKWRKILNVYELPEDQKALYRSLTRYGYINKKTFLKHFDVDLKKIGKKPPNMLAHIPGSTFKEKFEKLRKEKLLVRNDVHEKIENGHNRYYGIPQGSSISALLSNIYLIDYDKKMYDYAKRKGFFYRRYCDDILIVCNTTMAFEMQKIAIDEIRKYHLEIQDKKVEIVEFNINSRGEYRSFDLRKISRELPSQINKSNEQLFYKNLQYLGFEFNGKNVLIRSGSLSRYFRRMKARIVKTVSMAYSNNGVGDRVFKQKLLHRYTHLGKRNFLHYAFNASKEYYLNVDGVKKEGMNSKAIKRQLSRHFDILVNTLRKKNTQRAAYKSKSALQC
jgi:RNA-directed DNA polymerase